MMTELLLNFKHYLVKTELSWKDIYNIYICLGTCEGTFCCPVKTNHLVI